MVEEEQDEAGQDVDDDDGLEGDGVAATSVEDVTGVGHAADLEGQHAGAHDPHDAAKGTAAEDFSYHGSPDGNDSPHAESEYGAGDEEGDVAVDDEE